MLGIAEICSSDTDLENEQIQMSGLALTGKGAPGGRERLAMQHCLWKWAGSTEHRFTSHLMGGHSLFLHRRFLCCHTVLH